jgi:hypothetical protein
MLEFRRGRFTPAFGDIAGNGYGGPPDLAGEAENFFFGNFWLTL